jgi:hypothetical protein
VRALQRRDVELAHHSIACMARCALALSLSPGSSGSTVGTSRHDRK